MKLNIKKLTKNQWILGIGTAVIAGIILYSIYGDNSAKIYQNNTNNNNGEQRITNIIGDININNSSVAINGNILNNPISFLESTKPDISDITIGKIWFSEEKEIYKPGIFEINFIIKNTLNVPYNVSVDWILKIDGFYSRKPGLSTVSTIEYNARQESNMWSHKYVITRGGNWIADVNIEYIKDNTTKKKGKAVEFIVA